MTRPFQRILLPAAAGALVIAVWYGVHFYLSEDMRFLLPTPGAILDAFFENRAVLARAAWNTSQGALLGFGLTEERILDHLEKEGPNLTTRFFFPASLSA